MPVIDAHSHIGQCRVFDIDSPSRGLLDSMNDNGIDASIVQPYPGAPNAAGVHDEIAAMAKANPKRIFGIASINPHQDRDAYYKELRRCVKDLGFVGVKLHTIGHAVHPSGADATTVFECAQELGIPVMIHTGPGIPFAAPSAAAGSLRKFPKVHVLLAHAGHGIFSDEAVNIAQTFPQVSLEPSWCAFYNVGGMVAAVGAQRVLLGTDLPPNARIQIETFKALGLGKADLDMCLGGAAREFFKLAI